jgi:hypothetical protein
MVLVVYGFPRKVSRKLSGTVKGAVTYRVGGGGCRDSSVNLAATFPSGCQRVQWLAVSMRD